jgi:hypothetical protein
MKRQVEYTEPNDIGFRISCATCPLIPALKELDEEPRPCVSGIVTNVQGPVVMGTCKHYKPDSVSNGEGKTLWLECGKEDA